MNDKIKFVHTNLIAKDWHRLAEFYINVFKCEPVYPERDLAGNWVDKLTQITNVNIRGIHLRLPGYNNEGPTLEIFEYNIENSDSITHKINNYGFGHLAFHVEDVNEYVEKVIQAGGKKYGEIISNMVTGVGLLTAVYVTDPENNIIELQNWKIK